MRKRIWRMSEDRFDSDIPKLELSTDHVEMTGYEGQVTEGSFVIRSTNGISARGLVYSSNPYVLVTTPQFEGIENRIHFRTVDVNLLEGDLLEGAFTLACNQSELTLPFTIRYVRRNLMTSVGEITSLQEFADFAKEHWVEALQIFYTEPFSKLIARESSRIRLLYQAYLLGQHNQKNFEEFLVSCNMKERMTFDLQEKTYEFYSLSENQKEYIELSRNTWGYMEIDISSDSDFVTVEKNHINSDFFLGSTASFSFYVHKNLMHAGINKAKITFDSLTTHREILVIASPSAKEDESYQIGLKHKRRICDFTRIYLEYRLGRMSTDDWCKSTLEILDELDEDYELSLRTGDEFQVIPKNISYQLMRAHALIANKERQEALWIISDLKRDIEDKKSREWAYLLYLCTLIEKEENYVDRLTSEIEKIFKERPEDPYIFFFLLFLRKEYLDHSHLKLQAIKQWVLSDYPSPYFYLEALSIYKTEPYLLTELDDFSYRILTFAISHHALTNDLASQVARALEGCRSFESKFYKLAARIYDETHVEELKHSIIAYLLRFQCVGENYLPWYQLAISEKLHLTGLYEAYIMSLPKDYAEPLPDLVTMYFRYDTNMDSQYKAFIYSNIIGHRTEDPSTYQAYLRRIEDFALEELKLNHIDDNLAAIYQNLLNHGLVNEDIAEMMSKLLFMHKIVCLDERFAEVLFLEEYRSDPLYATLVNHQVQFPILTDQCVILLQMSDGTLCYEPSLYYVEQMIQYEHFYEDVRKYASNNLDYIIHDFSNRMKEGEFYREDMSYIENFLNSDELSLSYKASLYPQIITFLKGHSREDIIEKHMLLHKPYAYLDYRLMSYMIEIAINNGFYDEAYSLVIRYNCFHVDNAVLLKLCNYIILYKDFSSDDFLIGLCGRLLEADVYSEQTIGYLNRYYAGATELMYKVWVLARRNHIKSEKLSERTLVQMLYTEHISMTSGDVFEAYMEHNPNKMVVEAYLTYYAREYFLERSDVPVLIFPMIEKYYSMDMALNDSCKIGLMKYLSSLTGLNERREHILDCIVQEYIRKNIYFAFYKNLPESLQVKYHLYDKTFVEFHYKENQSLRISYQNSFGVQHEDEMIEMYPGLYVKQFVLFFGDVISYAVWGEEQEEILLRDKLTFEQMEEENTEGRYAFLNRMQSAYVYDDEVTLIREMKRYQGLHEVTNNLFTVI